MKFYIVDAFTDELFGGNPAGVVILEENQAYPDYETMRKTAAELRYSETAFIKQLSETTFQLRYFTPTAEVDLCGHATIGSFTALMQAGLIAKNGKYIAKTLAGDLEIVTKDGFILMEMGAPELIAKIEEKDKLTELYNVMGIDYANSCSSSNFDCNTDHSDNLCNTLFPMIISTGIPDIMMPVKDFETLNALNPDFSALSKLSEHYQVTGVHAFCLEPDLKIDSTDSSGVSVTARCRNFAPLYGIDEESATGTSNGALTFYLFLNNLIKSGRTHLFVQGEAMNRPSRIISIVETFEALCNPKEKGPTIKIQVGGGGKVLASGEIYL